MRMFQECLYEPTTVATIGDDLTTSFVSNSVFLILFDVRRQLLYSSGIRGRFLHSQSNSQR